MNKLYSLCVLALLFFMAACQEASELLEESAPIVVVEGYLFANSNKADIHLSHLIPYTASTDFSPYVNDANPILSVDDLTYPLVVNQGDTGQYYYPSTDLSIAANKTYSLEFDYNGTIVTATTTIPPAPKNVILSDNNIAIAPITGTGGGFGGGISFPEPITLSWDNEEGNYYFITIKNIETSPEPINQTENTFNRSFQTEPTISDTYQINFRQFEAYGTHQVQLFRVNTEYVDLYENSDQDSRTLTEPPTNIVNGLGIFTGVHRVVKTIEVEKL